MLTGAYFFDLQVKGDNPEIIHEFLSNMIEIVRNKFKISLAYAAGRHNSISDSKLKGLEDCGFKAFDNRLIASSRPLSVFENPLL